MFFFLPFISYLFCQFFIIYRNVIIARLRHFIQTQNFHWHGRPCRFQRTAFIVEHCANTSLRGPYNEEITYMQRTCLHQQSGYRTSAFIQLGFDYLSFGVAVRICFQFRHLRYQQNHIQQVVDANAFFSRHRYHNGVAAPFFRYQAIVGQFLFDSFWICFRLINFIYSHNNRHLCCLCMVNSLNSLRHHTIICSHYQNGNISNLRTASAHRRKCLMTWCIQECNLLPVGFYLICANMLCNPTSFRGGYMGRTNHIQ